jgi:UDP-2,3-diacylglucosamine pyrophosphatase LpxH
MTMLSDGIALETLPRQRLETTGERWRTYAHRRLSAVYELVPEIPLKDSSRIVFMSDCHRGDGSRTDGFARNAGLFLHALTYYYDQGFDYVEVGDGDELWKNWQFDDICRAYPRIFDLLHRFNRQNRLHMVYGNHDVRSGRREKVDKDGLVAHEGLLLRHTRTGQRVFVVHGHQADIKSDCLQGLSRLAVGYIWNRLQLLGFVEVTSRMGRIWRLKRMERAIIEWIQANRQIVISAHTHRPMSAVYGEPPYFNTGSCVFPGCITGLELRDGEISLVSWFSRANGYMADARRFERQLVAPPRRLRSLDW